MSAANFPSPVSLAIDNTQSSIRLISSRILQGCNVYHAATIICQRVALGKLTGLHTGAAGVAFAARFIDRFCALEKLTPQGYMSADFLQRLSEPDGVPFEEALFEAILAVEFSMAFVMRNLDSPGYGEIFPVGSPGDVDMVWKCTLPKISRLAAVTGCRGLTELLPEELRATEPDDARSFATLIEKLRKLARRRQRSITAEALAQAARRRGLPCDFIGGSYLRLGQGFAQHVIHASFTGQPSASIAGSGQDSEQLNDLPRPQRHTVTSADEARAAAKKLGYPVALKPLKGRQTQGTTAWARAADDIASAFTSARRDGQSVLVEECIAGQVHRLLIVDKQFVAACRIEPPIISGDGRQSVRQLLQELNEDPMRNGVWQSRVAVNDELERTLDLAGLTLDDVPDDGAAVTLHCAAGYTSGATCTDVTDLVHPDNREVAIRATEAAGLNVAGIDFVSPDISRSYRKVDGRIVKVAKNPELAMYAWPRHGKPRDAGKAILKLAFPGEQDGRIPIVLVVGARGKIRVARDTEYLLRSAGLTVGLALRKVSTMSGRPVQVDTSQRQDAARFLLHDPRVELVIGEATPRRIVKQGLRLDRCDVAAILNPDKGENIDSYQQGLMVLLRATSGLIVVSADNEPALALMTRMPLSRMVLLSMKHNDRSVRQHLASGGCAIIRNRRKDRDRIVLKNAGETLLSISVSSLATARMLPMNTRQIRARMIALALAYGVGLSGRELEAAASLRSPLNRTA